MTRSFQKATSAQSEIALYFSGEAHSDSVLKSNLTQRVKALEEMRLGLAYFRARAARGLDWYSGYNNPMDSFLACLRIERESKTAFPVNYSWCGVRF